MSPKPKTDDELVREIKQKLIEINKALPKFEDGDTPLTLEHWRKLRHAFVKKLAEIEHRIHKDKE